MRYTLAIGTAALSLALGASAACADNPNVPSWSPYALVPANASPPSTYPHETRAAIIESSSATVPNGIAPAWSPYALAPQAH